ncbi:MAG: RNA polymerase sigma factor [Clostridium sp.]|uniref:RNA polymerase sigma factor n=1 Tax=Clostridium sp. TaxID=1506 RepID=UPI003D6CC069
MKLDMSLTTENEKALINNLKAAKKGDNAAFQLLINENRLSLYRVAKGILKNEEDVADAIQETIINTYCGIKNLRKEEYFKTWLIKILINECNKIWYSKSKVIPMEEVRNEYEVYEDSYSNNEVLSTVNLLTEDMRVVILLYYYEDFSIKTISKILNIAQGTVKSRLSRARENLNELLTEGSIVNE